MTAPKPRADRGITLKWGGAGEVPIVLSDFMHWRVTDDRCYLTFGQVDLPLVEGAVPDGTEITVKPVTRIAVSATTLRTWLPLFQAAVDALPKPEGPKK